MQPSQVSQSLWRFFYGQIGRNRKCSEINAFWQLSTSSLQKCNPALLQFQTKNTRIETTFVLM